MYDTVVQLSVGQSGKLLYASWTSSLDISWHPRNFSKSEPTRQVRSISDFDKSSPSDLIKVWPFPGIAKATLILPQDFFQISPSRNNPSHLCVPLLIWLPWEDSGRLENPPHRHQTAPLSGRHSSDWDVLFCGLTEHKGTSGHPSPIRLMDVTSLRRSATGSCWLSRVSHFMWPFLFMEDLANKFTFFLMWTQYFFLYSIYLYFFQTYTDTKGHIY